MSRYTPFFTAKRFTATKNTCYYASSHVGKGGNRHKPHKQPRLTDKLSQRNQTMILNEFATLTPSLYPSRPCLLEGAPGIAKSAYIQTEVAKAVETLTGFACPVITFNLSTLADASELLGYQIPSRCPETQVATTTRTEPEIMRLVRETGSDQGILFLDELAQAQLDVQKATCTLILDRRLGTYHLPQGWWVVAASNRAKDRAGASRLLSILTNRVKRITVEMTTPVWLTWAETQTEINPLLLGFVEACPDIFATEVPSEDRPFCSYRSFTAAAIEVSKNYTPQGDLEFTPLLRESIEGDIGESATIKLAAFLSTLGLLPKWADIQADPLKALLPPQNRLDCALAASRMVATMVTPATADKAMQYIERLPKEMQIIAMNKIMEKHQQTGAKFTSPRMANWITENRALLSVVL
jgi:hypothetical protein